MKDIVIDKRHSEEGSKKKKGRPRKAPSKLDTMIERFQFSRDAQKRDNEFDPRKIGISIEEYLSDYDPEKPDKVFAEGMEKKAGRPRKDVRLRLEEFVYAESDRLLDSLKDQVGTEYNFLKELYRQRHKPRKRGRKFKIPKPRTAFHDDYISQRMPMVSGIVNVYEFQGRTKVMERLIEIVNEMEIWDLEEEEHVSLLWWWCKDAISRSHEEMMKISKKNLIKAFQEERRIYGMINQLERVRNRIRHVIVSAEMNYEQIRETRPKIGLVELMKQKKKK